MEDFELEPVTDLDEIKVQSRVPRIERVPFIEDVEGICVCEALYALNVHYTDRRSVLCTGKAKCSLHKTVALRKYLLIALHVTLLQRTTWFQLTPPAGKALLLGVKTLGRSLLGSKVTLKRKWRGMNAPILASVDPYYTIHGSPPKPIKPTESVRRVFGSSEPSSTPRLRAV
jgi:hypothetical protein